MWHSGSAGILNGLMANSLNMDLKHCIVVLKRAQYPAADSKWDDEETRSVFVTGGFGAAPDSSGDAMFVRDSDGVVFCVAGWMVERFVRCVPEGETGIAYVVSVLCNDGIQTRDVVANSPLAASYRVMNDLGWMKLPHSTRVIDGDSLLVEVEGGEVVLSPKKKVPPS
jgi:hypothetical protein